MREVRSVVQHSRALALSATDHSKLAKIELAQRLFEITHATVRELGGRAGSSGSVIARVDERSPQPAQLSIEGTTSAGRSASNYAEVEDLVMEATNGLDAVLHSSGRLQGRGADVELQLTLVAFGGDIVTGGRIRREPDFARPDRRGRLTRHEDSVTVRLSRKQAMWLKRDPAQMGDLRLAIPHPEL